MKLLPDANLSWRLTDKLKVHFTDCMHVDKTPIGYRNNTRTPTKKGFKNQYETTKNYPLSTVVFSPGWPAASGALHHRPAY
jgi:hypothetical protein